MRVVCTKHADDQTVIFDDWVRHKRCECPLCEALERIKLLNEEVTELKCSVAELAERIENE